MDWKAIREEFPITKRYIYLNTGAGGPMSRRAIDRVAQLEEIGLTEGLYTPPLSRIHHEVFHGGRERVAALLGVDPAEVAFTASTTAGINLVAASLAWQPGDEVIVSDNEHPGGYLPFLNLKRLRGIEVRVVPLAPQKESFLRSIEGLLSPRTRLICLSHVAWCTGYRLPMAEVGELARSRGIYFCVDGAQSAGQLPLNLRELPCDFYALPGQKWLFGPVGTGALYVRRERLGELSLPLFSWQSATSFDFPAQTIVPARTAHLLEWATLSPSLFAGMGEAIGLIQEIGLAQIQERIRSLATWLVRSLADLPRVHLHSPLDEEDLPGSGLVTFSVEGLGGERVLAELLERDRIVIRTVPRPETFRHSLEDSTRPDWERVRVSVNFFNTEEEMERLVEGVKRLAGLPSGSP
ncbi:MAG: aminotransferase class V-fold PLP-dependent enzyme [Candidatus Tectomicrobia bacterium]|uniref:Aminotransferase class V-fold PLP-dependent enzyme n=1 Tax=Tectimicrobiota bacterium TaxID=2528274 RepID=A0A932CKZ4_UNCTE|nr:aminotransferase class V-fold PLP-dependent enzyme [Candidatus Tectomicrobia bacterium]